MLTTITPVLRVSQTGVQLPEIRRYGAVIVNAVMMTNSTPVHTVSQNVTNRTFANISQ